ncbi:MAG TPA: HAD-IC family P-type ATPase [Chloroflexia bacterium]|nr:HAD-IC family P-type ATPase [Chloroflexia bacterium]
MITDLRPTTYSINGLTQAEVEARRARGEVNAAPPGTGRSYLEIVRQNVFTFINTILFAIGIALVIMGRPDDAIVTAGVVVINVVVGVVQETRAKAKLDKIALLNRPQATVVRDGVEKALDPAQVVLGDVLSVGPGDQVVADGEVIGEGLLDVDESLLTGESDLIRKKAGDPVYSGSFCVTGTARYVALKVGANSVANQITSGARAFRLVKTPLQSDVDFVIRILIVMVTLLGITLITSFLRQQASMVESVRASAVLVGLVPQGLFFMITVAYAVGAVRMSGKGALIQQSNAVESLSNVNVLCLDKTGTLTTNAIKFNEIYPLSMAKERAESILGDYALNTGAGNKTSNAIGTALKGTRRKVAEEVAFSSERKWSALAFDDPDLKGVYVLGAPEMLKPALLAGADVGRSRMDEWAAQGLRVLLFAYLPDACPLCDQSGAPKLPSDLTPACVLCFSDELRPEARETLEGFTKAGISLKVISGDNPETVAALARQAGFGNDIKVVSGIDLDAMDDAEFARVADETTIFGRIKPQQKQKLVQSLKQEGKYVAMIGDGVNDVLSLKQSHVGIAMQSGSQATRSVADLILLNDSFGVLPGAFQEGQRIINGMYDVVRLLLSRTIYLIFLIVGSAVMELPFPITPKHNSILAILTVGIPTVALVAWARPGNPPARLIRAITHFVVPASLLTAFAALELYLGYIVATENTSLAQTVLTTTLTLCGLLLIPFVEPPTKGWVGGDVFSGDRRPTILAAIMLAVFLVIMLVPSFRSFFELSSLSLLDAGIILAVVAAWALALRFVWRARVLERLTGTSDR